LTAGAKPPPSRAADADEPVDPWLVISAVRALRETVCPAFLVALERLADLIPPAGNLDDVRLVFCFDN
jgi:hypothetical protein